MPASTNQLPSVALPGLEYFPQNNTDGVLLGPRLSKVGVSTTTSIPATTVALVKAIFPVTNQASYDWAAYFHLMWSLVLPQDTTGQLQVLQARLFLGVEGVIELDVGASVITSLSPPNTQVAVTDRDLLYNFQDFRGLIAPSGTINLNAWVTFKNNDAGAAHSVIVTSNAIWRELRGVRN